MRTAWIAIVLLSGCADPARVKTSALQQLAAEARGTVVDSRGAPVEGANVVVRASQKPQCSTPVTEARTTTDRLGRYSTLLSWAAQSNPSACITVSVTGAGTSGSGSGDVTFAAASPSNPPNVAAVDVRLVRARKLTKGDADAIAARVVAAINGDAEAATSLVSHLYGGRPSVEAGLRNLRHYLGQNVGPASAGPVEGSDRHTRYAYRLKGSTGKSTELIVHQDETVKIWNPLLYYSARADRFVSEMFRLIAANDATTLARVLTADDIDFPDKDAQAIIDDYRRRFGSRQLSGSFDRLEETRNSIVYRINGTNDEIELGYGDGLLFLKTGR